MRGVAEDEVAHRSSDLQQTAGKRLSPQTDHQMFLRSAVPLQNLYGGETCFAHVEVSMALK